MPRLAVRNIDFFERAVGFSLPFRFGAVAVTSASQVFARVEIEIEGGKTFVGASAELLVPKWFDKRAHLLRIKRLRKSGARLKFPGDFTWRVRTSTTRSAIMLLVLRRRSRPAQERISRPLRRLSAPRKSTRLSSMRCCEAPISIFSRECRRTLLGSMRDWRPMDFNVTRLTSNDSSNWKVC